MIGRDRWVRMLQALAAVAITAGVAVAVHPADAGARMTQARTAHGGSPSASPTPTTPAPVLRQRVQGWITTGDQSRRVADLAATELVPGSVQGAVTVRVDATTRFQQIDGFGAALSESSAHLLMGLPSTERDHALRALFDPATGAGLDLVRVPLGASDFARTRYSYDDVPAGQSDPQLTRFSLTHDDAEIIPILRQAIAINPRLRVMGTPWSAPGWMKTSGSLIGGTLTTGDEPVYARYLTKVVRGYRARGIPLQFLTLQNEPRYSPPNYPGMTLTPTQETTLAVELAADLASAGYSDVRLIGYDHNWDDTSYPDQLLTDPIAHSVLAGTAFHCYAGGPSAQSTIHAAHPDKGVWFTECTGGAWSTDFRTNLGWNSATLAIATMRNWSRSLLLWNLALDPTGGPHLGGCSNCRGVLTIDPATATVTRNVEYDVLALAGKTVAPGATRIDSTNAVRGINTVAYQNPDGTLSATIYNSWGSPQTVTVTDDVTTVSLVLPGNSTVHLHW